jgi:amino acid adenylation domain-containing protein
MTTSSTRRDILPLSPLQHGLLFLAEFDRDGIDLYSVQQVIDIGGDLDPVRLAAAGQQVMRRHASLRACFRTRRSGEPVQFIRDDMTMPWSDVDLTGLPLDVQEAQALSRAAEDRLRRFSMSTGPLARATLIRRDGPAGAEPRHTLILTAHHIVVDGWSLPLVARELLACYEGIELPEPVPYRRYLAWLSRQDADASRAVWDEVLAGVTQPTRLAEGGAGGRAGLPEAVDVDLPAPDTAALTSWCRERGLTLNAVVRAAWAALLGRLTGRSDVVFGAVTSGRSADVVGVESIVGLLANTVPVRVELPLSASLAEVARAVADQQLRVLAHEHVPLGELTRRTGTGELFDTVMMFQNYGSDLDFLGRASGLRLESTQGFSATHYPLGLIVTPSERLGIRFQYDPCRFTREQVEALGRRLLRLLRAGLDGPVAQVDLLEAAERHEVLVGVNDTAVSWPSAMPARLLAAQAAATPAATALRVGERTWTYRDLHERSSRLARALARRGVGPGEVVAIAVPRSADLVVAVLAVLAAGGSYLPIDPRYPADRIQFMIDDAAPVLILDPEGAFGGVGVDDLLAEGEPEAPAGLLLAASPADPAYVIYTSGSTGRPKGVVVPNGALANFLQDMRDRLGVGETSRVLATTTFGFDICHLELLLPLISGGEVDLVDRDTVTDPALLADLIRAHDPTLLQATPTLWHALDAECPQALRGRQVISGGEALGGRLAERLVAHSGQLINMYGPTETTIWSTAGTVDATDTDHPSIGRPIANTRIYILDRGLQPCPAGVVGGLYIAGDGLATSYLNRPELTAARFVADPFGPPGSRMYWTGDLARWRADGRLDYLGRVDHQVKIRGHRIELGEIETVLAGHPGVAEVAVRAVTGPRGAAQLVAYPVLVPGTSLDERELRDYVAEKLPEHMVPSVVMVLPVLPLTANGKLDRSALPAPAPRAAGRHRGPVTVTEEILCDIVADLVGLPSVGLDDNFLALGGHSLLATRVAGRVRSALHAEMSLRDVMESRTLAELARRITEGSSTLPDLRAVADGDTRPAPAQRGLWFVNRLLDRSGSYNIAWAVRLSGDVDVEAMRAAVRDVSARHETLRTLFPAVDGDPRMVVRDEPVELTVVHSPASPRDGSGRELGATARERLLESVLTEHARRGFDLEAEAPMRAVLVRVDEREWALLLCVHHIAADGWSLGPLSRDLAEAYTARRARRSPRWAPLPVRYSDYASWQRRLLGDESDPDSLGRRQLEYWSATLAGLPDELDLPCDLPRPAVAGGKGGVVMSTVGARTHEAVVRLARDTGTTRFMVVQAALSAVLTRLGAGTDLPIGIPVAGRTHEATEDLVGLFVNTLVLRTDTSADPTFRELLGRVSKVVLGALAHADVPFERVVDACGPVRSLARHPLFQVLLSFQGEQPGITELDGLQVRPQPVPTGTSRFDLVLQVEESFDDEGRPRGLELAVEYSADLFTHGTAAALADRFAQVLSSVVEDPGLRLSEVDVLLPGERDALVSASRGPRREVGEGTLAELFTARAAVDPHHPAVIEGDRTLTYGEVDRLSDGLARSLIARGVVPGDLVALRLPRSVDNVLGILGVLKAGAAYLPLDPSHPPTRARAVVEDARPRITVTGGRDPGDDLVPDAVRLADLIPPARHGGAGGGTPPLPVPVPARATAYVVYTSGSTGLPKGVWVSQASVVALVADQEPRLGLGPGTRTLHFASPGFDAAAGEIFLTLLTGGTLVVLPDRDRVDGPALVETVRRHGVTLAGLPPAVLGAFPPECSLPRGLTLLVAGEACPPAVVDRWARQCVMINAYGPTEVTITSTMSGPLSPAGTAPPIGRPLANTSAYLLDSSLSPVPHGAVGELYLAGALLADGYRNRPTLTAERFVADPFGPPGHRMYRTGDLARRRPDGDLVFVGRGDDQVQVRGHRVEPAEIEAALLADPRIAQAAVVPRRGPSGPVRLVAYVVTRDPRMASGPSPDADLPALVRASLAERLPAYLVPSAVVPLAELPLTDRGKVDRAALPDVDFGALSSGRRPRNGREERLVAAMADVLGLDTVTIDDNFFDLGGDSIGVVRLVSRAAEAGVDLAVADVFLHPTAAGLAGVLASGGDLLAQVLPLRVGDGGPALFCVHGALGLATTFGTLAARLTVPCPVHALQSPALGPGTPLAGSVEQLAADYLRTVRRRQPAGPVHLLGWSFGGLVAYEMARQLQSRGEPAGFVGMLDSYPVRAGDTAPGDEEILRGILDNVGEPEALTGQALDVAGVLTVLGRSAGLLAELDETALNRLLDITRHHVRLAASYGPGPLATPVTLFTAARGGVDRPSGGQATAELVSRWTEVGAHLTVSEVDCSHEHLLDREPAARIAAHISTRIGSARHQER